MNPQRIKTLVQTINSTLNNSMMDTTMID